MILNDYERRKKSDDEFIEYLYEYYKTGDETLIPKIYPNANKSEQIKPDDKHHMCKCFTFWPFTK